MNRNLVIAGASLLAFIAAWEGVKLKPYLDVGGIPTVCAGNTKDIEDREYSPSECAQMLERDVVTHGMEMLACVDVPLTQPEYEAYVSFSYNVGTPAFCGSTLARKLNAGDRVGACNELLRWNRAGGKVMRGLTKRRQAERELCLRGVHDNASGKP